jgi:BMFP domain-containing protein YqiC
VSRAEYAALAARVAQLEARLNGLQTQPLDTITQEVLAAMPEQAKGEANLIETVVAAVKQREQEVKFPWMDDAKWAPIRKGLSVEQVVALSGQAHPQRTVLTQVGGFRVHLPRPSAGDQ